MVNEAKTLIPFLENLGTQILKIYNSDFDSNIKLDNSPVTAADLLSHKEITQFLKENFPQDNIISEEDSSSIVDSSKKTWVVDPLDGTKDFIQKTGEFSILIALFENNSPIFGITYLPAKKSFYYAKKGEGAFFYNSGRESKIRVSSINNESNLRIVRSRNHFREGDQIVADNLKTKNFVKCGSAGIKFALISHGLAEVCFYTTPGLGIWDCASAHIILEEAGGVVFDTNGNVPTYDFKGRKMNSGFLGSNSIETKNLILDIIKSKL